MDALKKHEWIGDKAALLLAAYYSNSSVLGNQWFEEKPERWAIETATKLYHEWNTTK